MIKSLILAVVTTAGTLAATSAHAGVSWSININTPVVGTIVSGGPGYYDPGYYSQGYGDDYRPRYERVYAPAPVYVAAPVYRVAPPVAYYPPEVFYRPVPVAYPRYYPGWRHGHGHDRDHGRDHDGRR